jgi:glycosyltransferase involved in cell wall biosynthesis
VENQRTPRIVLPATNSAWLGGVYYLQSVTRACRELESLGLLEISQRGAQLRSLTNLEGKLGGYFSKIVEYYRAKDGMNFPWPLTRYSKKTTYWIPDLQDLELPSYFSQKELIHRDLLRIKAIEKSRGIYFSSYAALEVFKQNYGIDSSIAGVVRFSQKFDLEENVVLTTERINCGGCQNHGYFYLPNQWWAHKNHLLAINAFKAYSSKGGKAHLILTGGSSDYRWPEHQGQVANLLENSNNIHNLGVVERSTQLHLYRETKATIQPSEYEGWSSTIEESTILGTPVIYSNIPSNQEQTLDNKDAFGFDLKSIEDLTQFLFNPPERLDAKEIINRANMRWERFRSDLLNVLEHSWESYI